MNVNRIQLSKQKINTDFVSIPLGQLFGNLDVTDAIKRDYLEVETEKAINRIIDYEVTKLIPSPRQGINISEFNELTFKVELNLNNANMPTFLADLGLEYDDILYKRNKFTKTFLRFEFFDSDNIKTQNKVMEHTMFLTMVDEYYETNGINNVLGKPKQPNMCELVFKAFDPTIKTNNVGEGFNIFTNMKYIGSQLQPKSLYCRISLNSAVTGFTHRLGISKQALDLPELYTKLHLKYSLYLGLDGKYRYTIQDPNFNLDTSSTKRQITLYECIAL